MLKEFIDDLRRHGIAVFDLIQAGAGNHIFSHAETAILGVSGFPGASGTLLYRTYFLRRIEHKGHLFLPAGIVADNYRTAIQRPCDTINKSGFRLRHDCRRRERADARGSRHTATPNCVKTSSDEPMKSYIRIAPRCGIFHRLRPFPRGANLLRRRRRRHKPVQPHREPPLHAHGAARSFRTVIELLCRQIHREICTLHYGGQAVE